MAEASSLLRSAPWAPAAAFRSPTGLKRGARTCAEGDRPRAESRPCGSDPGERCDGRLVGSVASKPRLAWPGDLLSAFLARSCEGRPGVAPRALRTRPNGLLPARV